MYTHTKHTPQTTWTARENIHTRLNRTLPWDTTTGQQTGQRQYVYQEKISLTGEYWSVQHEKIGIASITGQS